MEHVVTIMSYDQLENVIRNLDLHSRIYMGQYDEILFRITGRIVFSSTDMELHRQFVALRDVFIPYLKGKSMNTSLGIWGDHTPRIAARSYDIQQCLRYQKAYHRTQGGPCGTVDARPPYIQGAWDMNIDAIRRYHEMLEQQGIYPDYKSGYMHMYPWCCPVIISRFGTNNVDIEWSEEVREIVRAAEQVAIFADEHKFVEIFELLYPDVNKSLYEKKALALAEYFAAHPMD